MREAPAHGELKPPGKRTKPSIAGPEGPAKRIKSEPGETSGAEVRDEGKEEPEGPDEGEEDVHVIKAHAVILASRLAYFERAMGDEWRESQDKSIEVEMADEEEYVTFRRLIKLCYGITFIKEGDRDLDFSELVHLIRVANAFECTHAVKQCTAALQGGELDWEGALQCIELAEILKGLEGMEGLAEKASDVLIDKIGPVDELFVPSDEEGASGVLGGLKLSDKVKDLSPAAFEALLSSEDLEFQTDNEVFWLLLSWVEAQSDESEEGKQALFTKMAKGLRFYAMDPGYILLVVIEHSRIIAAGLQYEAIRGSLMHANLARRSSRDINLFDRKTTLECSGDEADWTFDVKFTAAEADAIKSSKECRKLVGLVAGLPWYVIATQKRSTKSEGQRLGVYTMCSLPFEWMTLKGGAGFYFDYKIEVGVGTPREKRRTGRTWSSTKGIGGGGGFAAWEEVFREGTEWLVNGELHVRVTVETVNDQGPSTFTADA